MVLRIDHFKNYHGYNPAGAGDDTRTYHTAAAGSWLHELRCGLYAHEPNHRIDSFAGGSLRLS